MEYVGIGFDCALYEANKGKLTNVIEECNQQAQKIEKNLNLASPKQVSEVLFNTLKLQPPNSLAKRQNKVTSVGTSESVLKQMQDQHILPSIVLKFRSASRYLSGATGLEKYAMWVRFTSHQPFTRRTKLLKWIVSTAIGIKPRWQPADFHPPILFVLLHSETSHPTEHPSHSSCNRRK